MDRWRRRLGQRNPEEQMGAPRSLPASTASGRFEGRRVAILVHSSACKEQDYFTNTSPLLESISKISVSILDADPLSFLTFSSRPLGSDSSLSRSITHDAVSSSHLNTSFGAFERSTVKTSVTFESLSLSKVSLNRLTKSLDPILATT